MVGDYEFIVEFERSDNEPLRPQTYGVPAAPSLVSPDLHAFLRDERLRLSSILPSVDQISRSPALLTRLEALQGPDRVVSGFDQPFVRVVPYTDGDPRRLAELAKRMRGLPGVRAAYVKPPAVPAATAGGRSPTPDFSQLQGYLDSAPVGIDARFAWQQTGGDGRNVSIIDIEGDWQITHEDFDPSLVAFAGGMAQSGWRDHGTAVIGTMCGRHNGIGIDGIVPAAKVGGMSIYQADGSASSSGAIIAAADLLSPGDVLLIELHRPGPRFGYAEFGSQQGYIPIEWWPDDFVAIRYAVNKRLVVIAAGGNGAEDLDDALYDQGDAGFPATWRNPFDTGTPASEAVLVGAGAPPSGNFGPDRSRLPFSNFGSRMDCQGWGEEVATTGYGRLFTDPANPKDEDRWYCPDFSGTSAAAPIVAGAVAAIQSIRIERGRRPLSSAQIRGLLRTGGSPQTGVLSERIGPRPDLRQLIPVALSLP